MWQWLRIVWQWLRIVWCVVAYGVAVAADQDVVWSVVAYSVAVGAHGVAVAAYSVVRGSGCM